MSYIHMAQSANAPSSPTPSSFMHMSSHGGLSTVQSSLGTNSPSLFGSVGSGKQWTSLGQQSSALSSANATSSNNSLSQQLLMKQQQHLLNTQSNNSLNSSSSSSHLESILGLPMVSAFTSSSQNQLEKNFELQQEDFPPLPHRSNSHEPNSASVPNLQSFYQTQYSSSSSSTSNHHSAMTNGFTSSQTDKFPSQHQQQRSQPQSPISFKSSMDPISTLFSRHQGSVNNKTTALSSNSPVTTMHSQSLSNPTPSLSTTTATGVPSTATSGSSNSVVQTMIGSNGLPSSTITDQYGLVGLLQLIQQAEKSPETATLLNFDLTTLGLSMESSNDLHPSFLSPFSENQARPYEIDYQVPIEYQMGIQIRDKLPQVNFGTLNEDTLFFLFYLFGNDQVQLLAAAELYRRDWRYHKEERLWLTRIKNIMPDQKFDTYETGVYCVFDVQLWRKTHKSMRIDYDKLDVNPMLKQQQQDLLASKILQQQSSVQQQQQPYAPVSASYSNNPSR